MASPNSILFPIVDRTIDVLKPAEHYFSRFDAASGTNETFKFFIRYSLTSFFFFFLSLSTVTSTEGPELEIVRVSRRHMGPYLCIASNGVPPTVSKRIVLIVHCTYVCVGCSESLCNVTGESGYIPGKGGIPELSECNTRVSQCTACCRA